MRRVPSRRSVTSSASLSTARCCEVGGRGTARNPSGASGAGSSRVLTGPTLSPLAQFVTRVATPNLPFRAKYVPGPPKRFAQGIGAAFSVTAAVLALGFGQRGAAYVVLGLLIVAASLEAFLGVCLGCKAFAVLMRVGIVPEEVCERCNDIWAANS